MILLYGPSRPVSLFTLKRGQNFPEKHYNVEAYYSLGFISIIILYRGRKPHSYF